MFEFEFELERVSRGEVLWLVSFPDTGTFQSYPRSAFRMAQEWKWTLVPPVCFQSCYSQFQPCRHSHSQGFVDHLYQALIEAGFRVFLDSEHLKKGDDISACLKDSIQVSRILIPIFSTNYAESVWCLREASFIARQVLLTPGKGSTIAIPLFYNVTPSQVRRPAQLDGPYAEAFREHERSGRYSTQEICEWKAALFQLCRFSGWSLQEETNGWVTHSYLLLSIYMFLLLF